MGYSGSPSITAVCALAANYLDTYYILPWFSRVPFPSNLADFPSRLMDHPLLRRDLRVPERDARDAFKGSMSFIVMAKTPQSTWVGAVAKAGGVNSPSSKK